MINWDSTYAAIYRPNRGLKEVTQIDPISLKDLVGIEDQKEKIVQNTLALLEGKPANNTLLWGSRGTGKSSLIKAVFNEYKTKGLRLIEFSKEDLIELPNIIDDIRESKYKFVIFCDDLSFEDGDNSYKGLKPLLEGSIELPPKNVLVYASSNRRHLVTELHKDNEGVVIQNTQIHYSDAVEEKISLSDRFGLWISFYQGSFKEYLEIVDMYFEGVVCDRDELQKEAKIFSTQRASRSGRCAKQFYNYYMQILGK